MYSNFSTKIKFKDYRTNDLYLEAACKLGLGVWKMKYSIVKTLDRVQRKSKIIMKPRYNEIERKIIATGNYSYADKLKMDWALKRFQKEFMKTFLGRLIKKLVEWLGRLLA